MVVVCFGPSPLPHLFELGVHACGAWPWPIIGKCRHAVYRLWSIVEYIVGVGGMLHFYVNIDVIVSLSFTGFNRKNNYCIVTATKA